MEKNSRMRTLSHYASNFYVFARCRTRSSFPLWPVAYTRALFLCMLIVEAVHFNLATLVRYLLETTSCPRMPESLRRCKYLIFSCITVAQHNTLPAELPVRQQPSRTTTTFCSRPGPKSRDSNSAAKAPGTPYYTEEGAPASGDKGEPEHHIHNMAPRVRYRELLTWLSKEQVEGRGHDICIIVETAWKEDLEYTAAAEGNPDAKWHAVHSSGPEHSGILCLIRAGVASPESLRYHVLSPGRLLHLRVLFQAPFDILCTYQWAWNPGNAAFRGNTASTKKTKQHRDLCKLIDKWLGSRPQRSFVALAGDFNAGLVAEQTVCGQGVVKEAGAAHPDQSVFQELLRTHRRCALNTWTGRGRKARTYIPPNATAQHGSQIDFVIVKDIHADHIARKAAPFVSELAQKTGSDGSAPTETGQQSNILHHEVSMALSHTASEEAPVADLDHMLLKGWKSAVTRMDPQGGQRPAPRQDALTPQVQAMWQTRDVLHRPSVSLGRWRRAGVNLRTVFQVWAHTTRLQTQTRTLRQACRYKKIQRVAEVVVADNVFQAAKQFAPRNPRRRLQLRTADGQLQTHEAEFHQIVQHFKDLYDGPESAHPTLSEAVGITLSELNSAFDRLKPGKALPGTSAPAALWKCYKLQVLPFLRLQYDHHLQPGATSLPRAWCLSELVLLPNPGTGETYEIPDAPQADLTAATPSQTPGGGSCQQTPRPGQCLLAEIPQYAYVSGRSLSQALERVIGHCASVRKLVQASANNIHGKRQGRAGLGLYGGCHLSLDISCAYDHVPWQSLDKALQAAAVPAPLTQAIMLIHHTAGLRIKHCGLEQTVSLRRGLHQGCGLSPLLWAVYCGWLLQGMSEPEVLDVLQTNTSYADDMHYAWTILNGRDLEKAYAAMKHILTYLC
ncbi:unnamed protein product, partial [Symbiodinium sp. CCMP2456]